VLWLVAGLVVALIAGVVAYIALSRPLAAPSAEVPGPEMAVDVVVAVSAVDVRTQLTSEHVELQQMAVEMVPEGAIRSVDQALGQLTLVDLNPGEIILAQRLLDPNVIARSGRLALMLVEDQVLMAFPAEDLMSQVNVLKAGDHVDILFTLEFPVERAVADVVTGEEEGAQQRDEKITFTLLQNVTVAAIVGGPEATGAEPEDEDEATTPTSRTRSRTAAPQAILLTLSPQDALLLKHAKDADGIADIVLRAPGAEEPFTTEPVDVDYLINRYQIPIEVGR
jgi:pilus assembly protein CpaB